MGSEEEEAIGLDIDADADRDSASAVEPVSAAAIPEFCADDTDLGCNAESECNTALGLEGYRA